METFIKGMSDAYNILSEDEMDCILGGAIDCKRKYIEGNVECHKRYFNDEQGIIICEKNYKLEPH